MNLASLILNGNFDQVRTALNANPELVNSTLYNEPGQSSLLDLAVDDAPIDFIEFLLNLGADVNQARSVGTYDTPLHRAAETGNRNLANLLIQYGAKIDGVDEAVTSPLIDAARDGHSDMVKLLLQHDANPNRLSSIHHFLPLDYAMQSQNSACIESIQAAGGVSVTHDYDWENQPGYPIDVFVSNQIGPVYPLQFRSNNDPTSIRLATVNAKPKPLYLFTDELHRTGIRTELCFILAPRWSVLADYNPSRSKHAFPLDVLRQLAVQIREQRLEIREGFLIRRADPQWSDLAWPEGIGALVAIDHQLGNDADWLPENEADRVQILTLAPLKENGTWERGRAQFEKTIATLRTARWKKLILPDPIFADYF